MTFKIGKWANYAAGLAIALFLGGCYTDFGPVVVASVPPGPSPTVSTLIQPGDRINMIVFGETNLTNIYIVSPSGVLSLPLIGAVRAAGRTRAEIEREITNRYSKGYLQEPKVTISVVEFRPFYIMGEAGHPGQYPYYSGLNVLTAISTAGGLTYRASRTTVLIQRAGEDVWKEYPMVADVPILPGDLIQIPERYF
jgi:protein involved in polysaccharide export with SLBB domain